LEALVGHPFFFKKGKGPWLTDEDDKLYIDYVGSWGATILGHSNPKIISVVRDCIQSGLGFGAPSKQETAMAEKLCQLLPWLEMVRMVSSGTEATMSAIRLSRGFTGRRKILKFEGCYHGHSDALLVKSGSGTLNLGIASSLGVTDGVVQDTVVLPYNNLQRVRSLFAKFGDQIASIIVEPVAGNMSCVLPVEGFLQGLRTICDEYGSLLIFDEVMTGFRVAKNCAQGLFGVYPDLSTFGKVIGGGMPVAAFGGHEKIMKYLAPIGPVYQAGTLSGNRVAMSAGLAMLEAVDHAGFYENLSATTTELLSGLQERADNFDIPFTTNQAGSMFGLFFTNQSSITCLDDVLKCNQKIFKKFFHFMINSGVYFAPSAFEAGFVSSAHGKTEIKKTLDAAENAFDFISKNTDR
jgi:glutamate-1-semialdehyde 2,1-aminomutase